MNNVGTIHTRASGIPKSLTQIFSERFQKGGSYPTSIIAYGLAQLN